MSAIATALQIHPNAVPYDSGDFVALMDPSRSVALHTVTGERLDTDPARSPTADASANG
jgi:hypothetical protein